MLKLRIGTPAEVGISADRLENIRNLAQKWVDDGVHPALEIVVARRGVVFLHEAYGKLGPEKGAPSLMKDTIFPLASISKPITATAAMILLEEGLLGLNRPVRDYVPEFIGEGKDKVIVRHLLTHTSGQRDVDLIELAKNEGIELDETNADRWFRDNVEMYMNLIYRVPLWKQPDSEMSYGSLNYDLLGEIISRITGMDLADFAEQRIFNPLGMKRTFFMVPDDLQNLVVRRPKSAIYYDALTRFPKVPLGCGTAHSTASDMAIFGQMFLNGGTYGGVRILSKASVDAMTRNQIPGIGALADDEYISEAEWGFGWGVHDTKKTWGWDELLQSQTSFGHSGGGGVMLKVDPGYDMVVAYFSVYLDFLENGRPNANTDLFVNAIYASIEEL
jgi:CubicO group peptidase (beta-lactamase class C family)